MSLAIVTLEFVSFVYQCRPFNERIVPRLPKESNDDYAARTWAEKLHVDEEDTVVITAGMLKNSLAEAAKYLGMQIKGKGKSTYTKHIEAGIMVLDDCPLSLNGKLLKKEDVSMQMLFLPSDGVRGSGKRVEKYFPRIPMGVQCSVKYHIIDETVTESVFLDHLKTCGMSIGIGSFRPRNNGNFGRFVVKDFEWVQNNGQV